MTVIDPSRPGLLTRPGGWVLACAVAELIGMTAASAAARVADGLPSGVALLILILGGLIEGVALGVLQSRWLVRRFPRVSRTRWIATTVVIAGVGWALASAPAALGGGDGSEPSGSVILALAAALGLGMGAVLGAAQAVVLRRAVRHPWRWISISAVAWTPTMVWIFAGATLPDESWPTWSVILAGATTGLLAGATLGVLSLLLMPTLDGLSIWSRMLGRILQRNLFGLGGTFALLRVTGVRSGRVYELPVQYARDGRDVVVFPGGAEHKTWWRNLRQPHPVQIWMDGAWRSATGVVLAPGTPEFTGARATYSRRWTSLRVDEKAVLVGIRLARGTFVPTPGVTEAVDSVHE